ncbi:hypothetical protein [Shewanella pneumatophori]|uniref:Uncharacterized protein n=1 Tax=Shewanella pneumatophori TaxID=314092 RepID=A0A9X2CEY1_9GAMM|nr:hypothetical protein [Shewanella pneumatophori]MCL1137221.1 hypothetical protein [Shewanella pneumatophori]
MTTALMLTLLLVNNYPPLLNAFSDNGAEVGCHQIPKNDLANQADDDHQHSAGAKHRAVQL